LTGIRATLARTSATGVGVTFQPEGALRHLAVPPQVLRPERTDELWRHMCFEMFVRAGEGSDYVEINLSPDRRWAAYRFDAYRAGMADLRIPPPSIVPNQEIGPSAISARIELGPAMLPTDVPWRIGLSAVIEERDGTKSYWALSHPPGAPDFHHPDCFALRIPAVAAS
jgi:hypothetical protein